MKTLFLFPFCLLALTASGEVPGIHLADKTLKVELLDTHPEEFFLSHDMDLKGRLYLGSREAVFVYERTDDGGFQKRKELYRFPKDTWVYDLEVFGDDLLVLTNTALYRLRNVLGAEPKLEKILWGNPLGHHHQGLHGIEFAPDGDLIIVMGDPHPGVHMDKTRPDHLWLWTWYVGPKNRPVPYAGVGAAMRLDLDTYDFSVYASGLRNPCGISFDRDWNLFANDNDQESTTATPGRLMHVPEHSWNGWARGWDSTQNPARLDMIPNVNWAIDVPVGQGYYDHTTLGEEYRGSLFVANWGSRSVSHHPIKPEGAGFRADSLPFLLADGNRRPLSALPTNDGRLIVALCYMKGNAPSPVCQTDLLLISPRKPKINSAFDHSGKPLLELLSEPIQIRAKAHREILRQGGPVLKEAAAAFVETAPDSPAFSSLIFLAAAHGDAASIKRITSLAQGKGRVASLAWRAAAAHPKKFSAITGKDITTAAAKSDDPKLLTGLLEFLHSAKRPIPDSVATLAAHRDPFVRQSAAILLARHASNDQLATLAKGTATEQLASTLATVFRIWQRAEGVRELPEGGVAAGTKNWKLLHPEGPIDLHDFGAPIGIYRMADWWRNAEVRSAHQTEFDRLKKVVASADKAVASAAATGLFFLNDERVDSEVVSVLGKSEITLSIAAGKANKADLQKALLALKGAKLPTGTEIPEAFRKIDWDGKSAPGGDATRGKALFVERACVACHLSPHDGAGGSIGPTLVGVGERFPPSYLAASILVPNLAVSPNFHPNTVTMKDGTIHVGFSRPGAVPGMINLQVITGQAIELNRKDIAKQDASEQSLMPAGLVQTPEEMAHLIAYMRAKHPKPASKRRPPKTASPTEPQSDDPSAVDITRRIESTKPNAFRFPPTEAKFVRVNVLASNRGAPCIDELEVFSGDSPKNLALQSNGAKASASSLLKSQRKHKIEYLNDGKYGNARSWIPAEKTGWAQIEFPEVMTIDRVVLSRDRGGRIPARTPTSIDILVSKDGKKWKTVKKVRPPRGTGSRRAVPSPTVKSAVTAPDDTGFTPIFDGKSLDKWDHRKGAWEVIDGTISCTGKEETRNWIIWRGGTPSDFVLRLDFNYKAGNSGVQVRSDDLGKHQVFGYQVEIAAKEKMGLWHHSLLGAKDPAKKVRHLMATAGQEVTISADGKKTVKQVAAKEKIVSHCREGWNTMEIIAQGNTLTQKINGIVFSKVTDDDRRMSRRKGVIALQDHGKGCLVAFRNIRIKELDGTIKHSSTAKPPRDETSRPPNVILILADDFGWGDTSCNNPGSPIKTPHIDRIANEGIRFTNAHTPSSVCTPTRYGLLTGRYPWRSYLKAKVLAYYAPALIRKGRTTIPSYLKSQGYRTGGFGKWHLGLDWTPIKGDPMKWRTHWDTRGPETGIRVSQGIDHTKPFKNSPIDIGFDTYFGTPSNASRLPFFIQDNRVFGNPKPDKRGMMRDPAAARDKVDDIYVDKAIAFIQAHRKQHADRPFFVYLPLNAIHGAVQVPKRFEGKTGMTKREDKILWANENVGRMLAALDRMKLADDTLVIFTTDNGPMYSPIAKKQGHEPTGPYRGFKTGAWDGGTRVPFVARWPGHIPVGSTSDQLIGLTDVLATLAALCGKPLPAGAGPDSFNQLPALLQKKDEIKPRPAMVTASYRGLLTLRHGDWKAIFGTKWSGGHTSKQYGGLGPGETRDDPTSGQLYNLSKDPFETKDLWESHPEIIKKLRDKLDEIKQLDKSDDPHVASAADTSEMGLLSGQYQQRFSIYNKIYGGEKVRHPCTYSPCSPRP